MSRPLRIIYGVSAVGGGHTARARILGPALQKAGAQVDFLFSGEEREKMYGMEPFGDFRVCSGLRFLFNEKGGVDWPKTLFRNDFGRLLSDVASLDLRPYDLAVLDYEPVLSRAAWLRGLPRIGVAHQYAFAHDVPRSAEFSALVNLGAQAFAPADVSLGLHWHHFNQPVLPPVFDPPRGADVKDPKKILVYLNFEKLESITDLLKDFSAWDFHIYHSGIKAASTQGNLHFKPRSNAGFRKDMSDCGGFIGGAGFMSPTECLHLGVKILVKPQEGQPEQSSNAVALEKLGWGDAMYTLDKAIVAKWLEKPPGAKIQYPDTAKAIANWIVRGNLSDPRPMIRRLWKQVPGAGAPKL